MRGRRAPPTSQPSSSGPEESGVERAPTPRTPVAPKNGSAVEKRRLRNRLSQQAFRARQNLEISELKQRLAQFSGSESERNTFLVQENQDLRQRLWRCETSLRSLQATLTGIVDSVAETNKGGLNNQDHRDVYPVGPDRGDASRNVDSASPEPRPPAADDSSSSRVALSGMKQEGENGTTLDVSLVDVDDAPNIAEFDATSTVLEMGLNYTTNELAAPLIDTSRESSLRKQTTDISSDKDAIDTSATTLPGTNAPGHVPKLPPISTIQTFTFTPARELQLPLVSNSSGHSEHIDAYEMCAMATCLRDRRDVDPLVLLPIVSGLISAFVKFAWSEMEPWIKYVNGPDSLAKVTLWRMAPGPDTYSAIPPCFRPTRLQVAVPHPSFIDWCVFPFLRDKLIQYHSGNSALDEICSDVGLAYAIQADLSELVAGAESLLVNLSVHEIIYGIDHFPSCYEFHSSTNLPEVNLPAPNIYTLLHSKEYAWSLYKHLRISERIEDFRVDPRLFVKYPEFFELDEKVAQGIPLRSSNKVPWPKARPLDKTMMDYYRGCTSGRTDQTGHQLSLQL
ncbi:hypothetical protein PV08_11409 [Exophiala spinifera]|uniref:BZIP domain-containing protein n=1 Tax=Exophiala spinifera TaxID=91928 RepID=A0A0D2AVI1_9EURO|nr:uncharacterized protein PV08_11409 [Exophiala spinifera]KIW10445.1 hypothetical protein PV08_11409 [Exophiala spinifera]